MKHAIQVMFLPVLVVVILLGHGAGQARADSAAGTYVANVGGENAVLTLGADGRATLAGESGTWSQNGQTLRLVGSDGTSVQAQFDGSTIRVSIEGIQLVFHRQGRAAGTANEGTAAKPEVGSRFVPAKLLKGKRFKVPGYDASFVLPQGWRASDEQGGIKISSSKIADAVVAITAVSLSSQQQNTPVAQLLQGLAQEAFGEAGARIVAGPREFSVHGKPAGQMTLEAAVGQRVLRGRVGGIKIGRWGVTFVAIYPADKESIVGPVFDTVLGTFEGTAPKENLTLKAQLAGCWEYYHSSGGGSGSGSSTTRFRFDQQSNYDYHHYTSVSVAGASSSSESKEAGTYSVYGNELATESNKGESSTYVVSFKGRMLYLGNTRYLPCN